jgi:chaperonin GroES
MIQPIRNNVLIKCFEGDNISAGGIIVPDSVKTESNKCTVVAVGNGSKEKPMKLKPGMIGYRVKSWGEPIIDNGELFYIMEQDAIIAQEKN